MKKILIFSLAYYPKHIGGAEVAVKETTDRVFPTEIDFHLIACRFDSTLPKVEKIGNVLVHRIGFTGENPSMADLKKFPLHLNKPLFQFLAFWEARKLHKKNHYDAVWAMMAHSSGVPAVLFKIFYPRVPYLLTLQEGDPIPEIKRKMLLLYPLFRRAFIKADFVQAISKYLAGFAREMGHKGLIEVIPNGVDLKNFSQEIPRAEIETAEKEIGKKGGEIFLVTASRLVPKNGVGDIVSALSFLPGNIKLIILGAGPLEEGLRLQVTRYKLQDRVLFWGQASHQELPKYLKACDIFIRPSLSEGMGNAFIEAMAAGLPVIATSVGGIPDFLKDGETGLFCNVRDPKSIAEKVELLLTNKELRDKIVSNARKMVREKYDWDIIAKDMKTKVFDRLFESK